MAEINNPVLSLLLVPSKPAAGVRHTVQGLVVLYAIAVIVGIRSSYWWEESRLDLLVPLGIQFCLAWWAIVDGRLRQRPIPMLSQSWLFVFAHFLVPGYVIGTRGWRGLAFVMIHVGLLYVLFLGTMSLSGFGLFGIEWLEWFAGPG